MDFTLLAGTKHAGQGQGLRGRAYVHHTHVSVLACIGATSCHCSGECGKDCMLVHICTALLCVYVYVRGFTCVSTSSRPYSWHPLCNLAPIHLSIHPSIQMEARWKGKS
eukprot:1161966-Pelagomonas_calceolata.AAC.7